MKKINFFVALGCAALAGCLLQSCGDDDNGKDIGGEVVSDVHYDIWVTLGGNGGMGSNKTQLVQSVNGLEDNTKTIQFQNAGVDVTAKLFQESIIKGGYYYQLPKEKDRFGKYKIENGTIQTVAETRFAKNTYKDRRYTHAWTKDNELVVMAANGKADEVLWTKFDAHTMKIIAEGDLGLQSLTGFSKFSTSGLLRYRKSDDKLIYAFQDKNNAKSFYVAFINAQTMKVEKFVEEKRAEQMAGTAYGELLQHKMFFDNQDNLYIACNSQIPNSEKPTCQFGRLLRINNKAMEFDKNYEGFRIGEGKLVTVDYLGNNKALIYVQDPKHTGCSDDNAKYKGWGNDYNCYYALLDLTTDKVEELVHDGKVLPYSSGTFSQRSFILNGKAYIGVNPKGAAPVVYVYDIRTGKMNKGVSIQEGYDFDRIVYIANK